MLLEFLARFVHEAEIQEILEAQAFNALPSFRSDLACSRCKGGAKRIVPKKEAYHPVSKPFMTYCATKRRLHTLKQPPRISKLWNSLKKKLNVRTPWG